MRVLGIESTAHTFGVGIVEAEPSLEEPSCRILANERTLYRPPPLGEEGGTTGGIHPREAANHHAERAGSTLRAAFDAAQLGPDEIDAIAFSQGPGMGPCLRTGATVARALSLKWGVPLVGVNHCVAHLEIGRVLCGIDDPLLLYASGGNTQVIAYAEGRYRVFGETLDIGVGNFLDKFARSMGLPFPGGPEIERLAARGSQLIELPYSVKGMDVAFSGILTAAEALLEEHTPEDVSFSVQETVFAMLTEVTERAIAHVGKQAVVLGGGVACNERLTGMVSRMCADRGVVARRPEKGVLLDNGAMIAWTGALALETSGPTSLEASQVDQRQRTDAVDAPWRTTTPSTPDPAHGGEAIVEIQGELVSKHRAPKAYRHPLLDERIRHRRTRLEAQLLSEARHAGVATPIVLDVDGAQATISMAHAPGQRLRDGLDSWDPERQREALSGFGRALAGLHEAQIAHGDPTTSNAFLAPDGGVVLIDLGLAQRTDDIEPFATDLHVLDEALEATHRGLDRGFEQVLDGYRWSQRGQVLERLEDVRARGRYRGT